MVTPSTNGRIRIAIYVRVSDPKQKDNTSLASQEDACRGYVGSRGWSLDERHVYREVYSGAYVDRPQFDRLRGAIERRELDRVVVWHSDRFGRDPDDRVYLRVEAKRRGVTYVSVTDPMEDTPEGRLVDYIAGYAASVERRSFMRRSAKAREARVRAGKRLVGCKPPYGYLWTDEVDDKGRSVMADLRPVRLRRLLTQRELAERVGLTAPALSRLENGHTKARISTLRKLATALEVEATELTTVHRAYGFGGQPVGGRQGSNWPADPNFDTRVGQIMEPETER